MLRFFKRQPSTKKIQKSTIPLEGVESIPKPFLAPSQEERLTEQELFTEEGRSLFICPPCGF